MGQPDSTAFSTSSNEQREVSSANPLSHCCPASSIDPINLSKALCRPTSSNAARISPSSCFAPDGCLFALEEDSDAEILLKAFREHHGVMPFIVERFEDPCKIRNWLHFPAARR